MSGYTTALGLTLLIELPVYMVALTIRASRPWRESLFIGLGVNLISHPIAFLVLFENLERPVGGAVALVVTELAVVTGEAWMLLRRRISSGVALGTSAFANIASLVLGVAITR